MIFKRIEKFDLYAPFFGIMIGGPKEDFFLEIVFWKWKLLIDLRLKKYIELAQEEAEKREKMFKDTLERLAILEQSVSVSDPKPDETQTDKH